MNDYSIDGISLDILNKIRRLDKEQITEDLLSIAQSPVFRFHPDKFDLILTQKNAKSQRIILDVLEGPLISNGRCMTELLYYSDNPKKQARIEKYYKMPLILNNEYIFSLMLSLDDDGLEAKLYNSIKNNTIKTCEEFKSYYGFYSGVNRMKKSLSIFKHLPM